MMEVHKLIPIARPVLGKEEEDAILTVLRSGALAQGPLVKKFESAFASYVGVKHAIAVNSGTAALYLALTAHGIGPEDEVITTAFSFISTANAIMMTGAKPVFVDIREDTFNIDETKIENSITSKTKAILPVHLYGHPAAMDKIMKIAKEYELFVIEDCAQAHGAELEGKKLGSFGTGCFSFYATKNMTTGEGGMITTNDSHIALLAEKLRQHGAVERYHHELLGYNYRMTDIVAALGIEQLKKLELFNQKRIGNAAMLTRGLTRRGIITPNVQENCRHVFHQYTLRITNDFDKRRDDVQNALRQKMIECAVFYPKPLYSYPHLKQGINLPVTERMCQEVLSLPVHPSLREEEIKMIIGAFR